MNKKDGITPILPNGRQYLETIRQAVAAARLSPGNTDHLATLWAQHIHRCRKKLPETVIASQGEILHTGKLSPGCRACKDGAWDCIFITHQCNRTCSFCTLPLNAQEDWHGAAYGRTPEEFIQNIAKTNPPLQGVGFTGGEALMAPQRLYEWIGAISKARPDLYLWVYTNGVLATADRLKHLRDLGVSEVRFNMAATGYAHPRTLIHLKTAADLLPAATIEIPAIPDHARQLRNALPQWAAAGATYLNLHELMREPKSLSKQLCGDFFPWITPDGHPTDLHLKSRALVLEIMAAVAQETIPLHVNDCSSQSKLRQITTRRRRILPLVRQPYEKLEEDHFLSHICALDNADAAVLLHPDDFTDKQNRLQNNRYYEIRRTVPLSLFEPAHWLRVVELSNRKLL